MENTLELIHSNVVYMGLGVVGLIIMKYGVLGFILSRKVNGMLTREVIDSLVTVGILVGIGIWLVSQDIKLTLTHSHLLRNGLYFFIAIILYYAINISIGEKFGEGKSKNQLEIEKLTTEVPFSLFLISTGVLAPMFEEVVFRVYIQDLMFGNTLLGIIIASVLFSVMHMVSGFSWSGLVSYMGVSIVIGYLYLLSGGLLFSAIMHIFVNSLAVVFMYHGDKLSQLYPEDEA